MVCHTVNWTRNDYSQGDFSGKLLLRLHDNVVFIHEHSSFWYTA